MSETGIIAFLTCVALLAFIWLGIMNSACVNKKWLLQGNRCEYRADAKTGTVQLVWKDTGEPVEKQ